jgi:hypothetical protein
MVGSRTAVVLPQPGSFFSITISPLLRAAGWSPDPGPVRLCWSTNMPAALRNCATAHWCSSLRGHRSLALRSAGRTAVPPFPRFPSSGPSLYACDSCATTRYGTILRACRGRVSLIYRPTNSFASFMQQSVLLHQSKPTTLRVLV